MAIYVMVVALSIPGALFLTITGGILFGTLVGGAATVVGATTGATIIFLIARSACGESLIRRAGPLACKLADGFRADAFSYLLFLRLVPAFPFFLVNLVPALVGVKLRDLRGRDRDRHHSGDVCVRVPRLRPRQRDRRAGEDLTAPASPPAAPTATLQFDLGMIVTPQLLAALATLGVIALVPVVVKRLRARAAATTRSPRSRWRGMSGAAAVAEDR